MNYRKWLIPVLLVTMLLAACGASSNNSTTNAGNDTQGSMSLQEQLLVGTFKLEGTDLAVDQTQAADLLTLWQAYKELMSNNATAKEELDAVISQIQSSMTSDQLKAITDMKLTFADVAATMTSLGITYTPPTANGTQVAPGEGFGEGFSGVPGGGAVIVGGGAGGVPSSGSTSGGTGRSSGTGGGGAFGYDSGGAGGGNLTQSQIATLQAGRGNFSQSSGRIPTALLNALIDMLQKRSQP
jgi:hypothetical protein